MFCQPGKLKGRFLFNTIKRGSRRLRTMFKTSIFTNGQTHLFMKVNPKSNKKLTKVYYTMYIFGSTKSNLLVLYVDKALSRNLVFKDIWIRHIRQVRRLQQ